MSLVKGVESIVGAYLAIVIVIGAMFAFYTWVSSYIRSVNEQVSGVLEVTQRSLYPPILTIKNVSESYLVLEVYSYIPFRVKEFVAKSHNDRLLYHEHLNKYTQYLELVIPRPSEPALFYIITNEGLAYYYVPRLDPRLQLAPDHIKNKVFVDSELLDYLSREKIGNAQWSNLSNLGYKLAWGRISPDFVNAALTYGPVSCSFVRRLPCNINVTIDSSVITYWLNGTTFRHIDGFIEIVEYSNNYTQIYHVIRFTGSDEVVLTVNITLRATRSLTGGSYGVYFVPVVYVYDSYYDPVFPVTIYHPVSPYTTGAMPASGMRPWLARIPLTNNVLFWNSTSYYSGIFEVKIKPGSYGLSEGFIIVGIEAVVIVTGTEHYSLRVQIDITQ